MQIQKAQMNQEIDTNKEDVAANIKISSNIIENVNVWLNVLDQQLNIVFWNSTAERLSGYLRDEVLGHSRVWEQLYPDASYRQQITAEVMEMLTKGQDLENFETRIHTKDGQVRIISWNSRSLLDDDETVIGAVTFGKDITDRKEAETALQKAHHELSVLYAIASITSESLELDTILRRSLERVLPVMNCKKGTIHLWDEEKEILELVAWAGLSESSIVQLQAITLNEGLISQVWNRETPITTPNIGEILEPPTPNIPRRLFHAFLGVPMRAKGKTLGVFSILGKAGQSFTAEEINFLASISDQVGVAVENARLYEQSRRLAVAEERRRLARDLHDAVTQSLYSVTLFAEAGQRLMQSGNVEQASQFYDRLSDTAQNALKEMRLLLHELRPLHLEAGGLAEAIQERLDAVERRVGIKARLLVDQTAACAPHIEEELYYIIQEALNNTLKHAGASTLAVQIQINASSIKVTIADDGAGFSLDQLENRGGMGLNNMRERIEKFNGQLQIISAPSEGTKTIITIDSLTNRPTVDKVNS